MYKIISYREYCKAMNEEYTEPAPSWFDRAQTQAIKTIRSEIVDVKIFPRNSAMLHQLRPEWKEKVITGIAEQIYYTHNQQYFIENGVFANRSYNQTQYGEGPVNQLAFENAIKKVCNPCKTAFIPTDWFYKRWNVKFDPKKYYIKYDPIIKDVNWGQIGGWLDDQLDLVEYLTTKYTSQEDFLIFRHDVNEAIENGEKAITELDERVTYLEDHKVVANPSGTFKDVLNSIIIDGVVYGIGGGTFDPSRYYNKQETDAKIEDTKSQIHKEMTDFFYNKDAINDKLKLKQDKLPTYVNDKYLKVVDGELAWEDAGSGSIDYNDLINKPEINNVILEGQKTLDELGIGSKDVVDAHGTAINSLTSNKQDAKDNSLTTTDKSVVGAINELNAKIAASASSYVIEAGQNPDFQDAESKYIEAEQFVDVNGKTILSSTLAIGSNIYMIDADYPSRWYGGDNKYYLLDEKPDLADYAKTEWVNANFAKSSELSSETETRISEDAKLQTSITNEANTRLAEDNALQTQINAKASQEDLNALSGQLASEVTARTEADTALGTRIDAKQDSTDNNLETEAKTIVGAINEVNGKQALPDIPDVTKNYTLKALAGVVQWVEDETDPEQEFTTCDWEDIIEHCNKLEDGTITDTQFCEHYGKGSLDDFIGLERTLTINNGQDYKVRVIGIKHDTLATSGRAALTFQFTNFLCDSNGYSLAALWHDTSDTSTANFDFLNSTMRANLTGEGSGTIAWYEKGATTKSETYRSSVLDMLPAEIKSGLKSVVKKIGIGSASTGTHMVEIEGKQVEVPNATYTVQDYNTKVFLLSHSEITSASSEYALQEGAQYAYWQTHDTAADRIMQQLKGSDGALTTHTEITDPLYGSGYSYAGYNSSTAGQGGRQWLRSPDAYDPDGAWYVSGSGVLYYYYRVYNGAFAVTPCFCI